MKSNGKLLHVDLLRGWAMIVMVEVHVFNAFLRPEIRNESWFSVLNFINGMVAPSFIFISGFAFVMSTGKSIDDLRNFGSSFYKRLWRIAQIFLVGYLVHIPYFSLRKNIYYLDSALLKSFYNVDVLQCIGAGLLMLFIFRLILKKDEIYSTFLFLGMAGFVSGAPFVWKTDFSLWLPLPLACYFNEVHGSFFPVFPWLGFLFAGALFAVIITKIRSIGAEDKFMKLLAVAGILFVIISSPLLFRLMEFPWFEIKSSPLFFIQRLGVVFVLLFIFRMYYKIRGESESIFLAIGRESLLIYWLHLQIIFRLQLFGENFYSIVNRSFGVTECALSSAGLILLMIAVAVAWSKIKTARPVLGKSISYAGISCGLFFFIIAQ